MSIRIGMTILFLSLSAQAVEAPPVAPGDYLFVRGKVVGCGPGVQTVDFAEVSEQGDITVLSDITLAAAGQPVHVVTAALADALETRTGHRPETLELIWVAASDQKQIAMRLLKFTNTAGRRCRIILDPGDPAAVQAVSGIAYTVALEATDSTT